MTSWGDEIDTTMHTVITNYLTIDLCFSIQVLVKSGLHIVDNWLPTET